METGTETTAAPAAAEATDALPAAPTEATAASENAEMATGTEQQPAPAGTSEQPGLFGSPVFYVAVLLWLMVLWSMRKQKKREADRKGELDLLKKGDKVVTIGRMHGTVVSLTDTTMTLKTDEKGNNTVTFDRVALHKIVPRGGENAAQEAEK